MTFLPRNARLTAVLPATKDFPSPGWVEEKRTTLSSLPSIKRRLVRRPRKVSSIMSFLFSRMTITPFSGLSHFGSSARIPTVVMRSTSSRFSILYFNRSRRYTKPTGIASPIIRAAKATIFFLGDIGYLSGNASSMMRPLVAVAARVMAFSSRFCNSMM